MPRKMNKKTGPLLQIGASKEAVNSARSTIMEILNTERAGDPAKVAAFETLRHLCEVKQVNITNCDFRG